MDTLRTKDSPKNTEELREICYELDQSDDKSTKITKNSKSYQNWVNLHIQKVPSDTRYFDYLGLVGENAGQARKKHAISIQTARADETINSSSSNSEGSSENETVSFFF